MRCSKQYGFPQSEVMLCQCSVGICPTECKQTNTFIIVETNASGVYVIQGIFYAPGRVKHLHYIIIGVKKITEKKKSQMFTSTMCSTLSTLFSNVTKLMSEQPNSTTWEKKHYLMAGIRFMFIFGMFSAHSRPIPCQTSSIIWNNKPFSPDESIWGSSEYSEPSNIAVDTPVARIWVDHCHQLLFHSTRRPWILHPNQYQFRTFCVACFGKDESMQVIRYLIVQ